MDRQYCHGQTLMACAHGHRPHMYQRQANRQTAYFVECSPCKVRTHLHPNPEAAATAWHDGEHVAISHVAMEAAA